MSNYRNLYFIAIIFLLPACMQKHIPFVFSQHVNEEHFFNNLPAEARNIYPGTDIQFIDSVKIYVATFKESYIESNQLLEWSELNDSSKVPKAKYLDVKGNATRLYLCTISTYPEDIQAAVFFSAKYNADGQCLGFGPAYFGKINTGQGTIAFTTELAVKKTNEIFALDITRKQNRKAGILFIANEFRQAVIHSRQPVNLEKIVLLDPNKIGGNNPVVFSVKDVLQDENAMLFRFLKTIQFKKTN